MPSLPVPPAEIALALTLAALGSVLQGSVGFGLAVVAAPLLLLIDPVWVPGPMLLAAVFLTLLIALRHREHILGGDVALGAVGRALGMIPAAYAIGVVPGHIYDLLFAVIVLLAVVLSGSGLHIARTPSNVLVAGILSGVSGTISAIGGPPMALVYQHERGPLARGTMSLIFLVGTWISIAGLWWVGRFGRDELILGLLLMPAILVGFAISHFTARWLDRRHTRPAILALSALSALIILARALVHLM